MSLFKWPRKNPELFDQVITEIRDLMIKSGEFEDDPNRSNDNIQPITVKQINRIYRDYKRKMVKINQKKIKTFFAKRT